MTLIDGFRSHHGTLTDELHIIEIAVHINAVHYQMQVRNATLGITMKGGKILRIGNIGRSHRCSCLAFSLANVVNSGNGIYLTNELFKTYANLPCSSFVLLPLMEKFQSVWKSVL